MILIKAKSDLNEFLLLVLLLLLSAFRLFVLQLRHSSLHPIAFQEYRTPAESSHLFGV